jgi:hypothetical protein
MLRALLWMPGSHAARGARPRAAAARSVLAAYAEEYRRAMAAANLAERRASDLAKAAKLLRAEHVPPRH